MDDAKISNTARVGYKPEFEQPVGKVTLQVKDFRSPDQLDRVSDEDAEKIQAFLEDYTAAREDLENFDRQLENFLSTPQRIGDNGLPEVFSIPYDPLKFPEIEEAHHHICGRPGASNVITYEDIKRRSNTERALLAAQVGLPENLDELGQMDGRAIQEKVSQSIAKAVAQMLDAVWRQIVIWALELMLATVKPLASIKFVKTIPRLIQRAINRLKGNKNANPRNLDQQIGDVTVNEEGEITAEDLAKAGGGYIASIKEVAQNLPPECLIHTSNWNRFVDSVIRDGPYASAYYAKKINGGILERMDALNKMAAVGIPNGHVFTYRGTQLNYTNPLPEEYLQARADGSTRFGAIADGLQTSIREVRSTFVPRMERVVRNLIADPNLLCCLIRNISLIANTQKLRRILLYIQALLQFWRNLHVLDISKEVARLGNLIIDLVNRVLQSIFSLYIAFFNSQLNKIAVQVQDLQKFTHLAEECRPWNQLINLAVDILTEMLQKITEYFTGFFGQFRLDIRISSLALEEIEKLSTIDKYLDLINKVLRFAAAWAACLESNQDPRVILSRGSRLSSGPNGVNLAPRSATNRGGALSPDGSGKNIDQNGDSQDSALSPKPNTFAEDGPFSSDGLQVLLTNFLGVENTKAREVINSIDDCACDKSLTPEELADIEKFIKEKS